MKRGNGIRWVNFKVIVVGAAGAAIRASKMGAGGWDNLTSGTRRLFQTRGLGRGLGTRTPTMASRIYENCVPRAIRCQGEYAVKDFLKGKHFSHKRSVASAPHLAKAPSNIVLEKAKENIRRGSRNMTVAEVSAATTATFRSAAASTLKSGAKTGVIAAAIEAPIAGIENCLHWRLGRKTGKQAAKDTAKSTAVAGIGAAVSAPLMLIPLGPLGAPVAVAGGTLAVGSAVYRITMAARPITALTGRRLGTASALWGRITRGRRRSRLRLGARSSR